MQMKVVIDHDGNMEIRATSPEENYMLKRWHEDWLARRVTLKASWKSGDDFLHAPVEPQQCTVATTGKS
jgi:hypothetical protein